MNSTYIMGTKRFRDQAGIIGIFVIIGSFWFSLMASSAPPPNDNFADRILLQQPLPGGSIIVTGTLNGATMEADEFGGYPYCCAPGPSASKSVWWELVMTNSSLPVMIEVLERTESDKMNMLFSHYLTNSDASAFPISGPYAGYFSGVIVFYPVLIRPGWLVKTNDTGTRHYLQVLGTDDRSAFKLKLTTTNAAPFLAGPTSRSVQTNGSVVFSVSSHPTIPKGCQWLHDGVPISGETNALLFLNAISTNQTGDYSVIVTNYDFSAPISGGGFGVTVITSVVAHLNVVETNGPPEIEAPIASSSGNFVFQLQGDVGRSYRIESSTNLTDWSPENSFLNGYEYFTRRLGSVVFNTNGAGVFSIPLTTTNRFLRASIYRPPNEICNANLKAIRFAKEHWAKNTQKAILDDFDLDPFIRASYFRGVMPVCPDGGVYTLGKVGQLPTCSIPGHVLEEPQ